MSEKQVRDYDKFMLRFPDGMRDAIAERAKANGRSMNSEIVQILEDTIQSENKQRHKAVISSIQREIAITKADATLTEREHKSIDSQLSKIDELTERLELLIQKGENAVFNKKPT